MKREFQKLTVWKYGEDLFEDQESCIRQMIADNTLELKEESGFFKCQFYSEFALNPEFRRRLMEIGDMGNYVEIEE